MQPNGRDRRLQFMRNCIDKAVMLLVAPHFAHEKNGIYHHSGNDQSKKDDAEEQQHALTPIEDDPADVESNRERNQANAQAEKERNRSTAARDAHTLRADFTFFRSAAAADISKSPRTHLNSKTTKDPKAHEEISPCLVSCVYLSPFVVNAFVSKQKPW